MLSAIVLASPVKDTTSPRDLGEGFVRTLASLVPAAIEGIVRDVVLAGGSEYKLQKIADHAGCSFVEGKDEGERLSKAISLVRGPLLFVILAGRLPDHAFGEEVQDLLRGGEITAVLREQPGTFIQRLFPSYAPVAGLIIPARLVGDGTVRGFSSLVGKAKPTIEMRSRARRIL